MSTVANFQIDVRLLPPIMKRLVRAIGIEDTIKLLRWRGGTDLPLPTSRSRKAGAYAGELRRVISADKVDALYAEFADGNKEMTLPKADKILMQYRNCEIRRLHYETGVTIDSLAMQFDLTGRQVWNILHSAHWPRWRNGDQADMFE